MYSLHRASICIDGIGTIHDLFFDGIVPMSTPHLHVIADVVAQENVFV